MEPYQGSRNLGAPNRPILKTTIFAGLHFFQAEFGLTPLRLYAQTCVCISLGDITATTHKSSIRPTTNI